MNAHFPVRMTNMKNICASMPECIFHRPSSVLKIIHEFTNNQPKLHDNCRSLNAYPTKLIVDDREKWKLPKISIMLQMKSFQKLSSHFRTTIYGYSADVSIISNHYVLCIKKILNVICDCKIIIVFLRCFAVFCLL